jgi:hypothetical protein
MRVNRYVSSNNTLFSFFLFLPLCFCLVFLPFDARSQLSPEDEQQEERFARIYQKFNSNEQWDSIAQDHKSETYTLQGGDTLWDISTKFFGTGFYWPKIWQLNFEITNPHFIVPGNALQFSPGSTTSPPSLAVSEGTGGSSGEDSDRDSLEEDEDIEEQMINQKPIAW